MSGPKRESARKERVPEDPSRSGGSRQGETEAGAPALAAGGERVARRFAAPGSMGSGQRMLLRLQRSTGNASVRELVRPGAERVARATPTATRGRAAAKPDRAPRVEEVLPTDYPHLDRVLTSEQKAQIQTVLDAAHRSRVLRHELETRYGGTAQYLSENTAKIEALRREIREKEDVVHRKRDVFVPTEELLASDVVAEGGADDTAAAFREDLFTQLSSLPTRVRIDPDALESRRKPLVKLIWGRYHWEMHHQGGLVRFQDLLQIQKISMPYMLALEGRKAQLELEILELQREAGRIMPDMEGKKVGEIYYFLNNRDIRIGQEVGRISGYPDDDRGHIAMYADLLAVRQVGARVVLRGPGGFLHIFATKPNFGTTRGVRLTKPTLEREGTLHLLREGTEVDVFLIVTADEDTMREGPKGWYISGEESTGNQEFAIGAIFGDAVEDPTVSHVMGQVFIGLIPIVGQIADARDVGIGIHKIWTTGGKEGKLQTLLAAVGLVPLLGDLIKPLVKAGRRGITAAKELASLRQAVPAAQQQIAKELLQNPAAAAKRFGLSPDELKALRKSFDEMAKESLKQGGVASTKYVRAMAERLDSFDGHAGALVAFAGGKWADVAKTLNKAAKEAADKETRELAERTLRRMQDWRQSQVDLMKRTIAEQKAKMAKSIGSKPTAPDVEATGTASAISDLDMSFKGPSAARDRLAAIRYMERTFGKEWRDLLDADIFVDPRRLHMFESLPAGTRRGVEEAVLRENQLNILAKLAAQGAHRHELVRYANSLGMNLDEVLKRQKAINELMVGKALSEGASMKEAQQLAKKLGFKDLKEVDLTRYRRFELEVDVFHHKFEAAKAAKDTAAQAHWAQKMAERQSLLNAANEGAYATAGGGAKEVTRRSGIGGLRGAGYYKMSPTMGLEYVLDQLPMLQATRNKIAKNGGRLNAGTAKALMKYSDRILVTAGQYGAAFSAGKGATREAIAKAADLRELFGRVDVMLQQARRDPSRLVKAEGLVKEATADLYRQLDDIIAALKANSDEFIKTGKGAEELVEGAAAAEAKVLKDVADAEKNLRLQQQVLSSMSTVIRSGMAHEEAERKRWGKPGFP